MRKQKERRNSKSHFKTKPEGCAPGKTKPRKMDFEITFKQGLTVAITGTSGFLGSALLKELEKQKWCRHLVAIDRQKPSLSLKNLKFFPCDLTNSKADDRLLEIFEETGPQVLVHAALFTKPPRNLEESHELQSIGTMRLLTAAAKSKIGKLILASTTEVYGAFPDNPNFLTEEHPLRGEKLSPFLKDKVDAERQFLAFAKRFVDRVVTILRPATILGPTVNNFKTHFFQTPIVPTIMGYDPLIQFVHEFDILQAFIDVIPHDHPGPFNIVANGVIPLSRAIRIAGKVKAPIPSLLFYPMAEGLWYMDLGPAPAAHLNFLRYLCVADGRKAWKEFGFKPVYATEETLFDFVGMKDK